MENPILPDTINSPKKNFSNKKTVVITVIVVVVLAVAGYVLWKYKNKILGIPTPITKEEKIDILNKLNTAPPNDGSVELTVDERLKILNTITNKKPDPKVTRTKLTPEEQQKMFDSLE